MAKIAIYEKQKSIREYSFTVVFEPVARSDASRKSAGKDSRGARATFDGYQVTVPLLPGLITYGRTLSEAREMARDAIRCHLEGLRKDGEPIPNERSARKEKLRVALTA
jgi:predicted RNase H-like HicB family nuclease